MFNRRDHLTLKATASDRLLEVSRHRNGDLRLGAVLELDGRLDESRLERAVRLVIEAEPVLGSRSMDSYWQPYANLDDVEWFTLDRVDDQEKALDNFLVTKFDVGPEQQVKFRLIRTKDHDAACVKMDHGCSDLGGLKALLGMLAETYTQLGKDKDYTPQSNRRARKDPYAITNKLGLTDLQMSFLRLFPPFGRACERRMHSVRKLPLQDLYAFAKKKDVTLNDLLVTACYRILPEFAGHSPEISGELLVTVDLRRYFPNEELKIENLSSMELLKFSPESVKTFESTLGKVSAAMDRIKTSQPGLQGSFYCGVLSVLKCGQKHVKGLKRKIAQAGKAAHIISNAGKISESTILFDKIAVVDAYLIGPAFHAPGFLLVASTYNNILTFTLSLWESETSREKLERFMDRLVDELNSDIIQIQRESGARL